MRIVSVLPSATEIVCALGLRDELVGRSAECDFPPSVRDLPVVMRARTLDSDRPSAEIDQRVRAARRSEASLYALDIDLLASLRPDVLLTQDLCGVCSVTTEEVAEGCARAGVDPKIVTLTPRSLREVWDSVETIGGALAVPDGGRELSGQLRARTSGEARPASERARVAVVEWVDPPILAGLWVGEMIAAAGGESVGPEPACAGERTTWSEIAQRSPDLVVVSPCSFSVERTRAELQSSPTAQELGTLRPRFGTWLVDEAFFSRPGPRLADGVELLRALASGRSPPDVAPRGSWTSFGPLAAQGAS